MHITIVQTAHYPKAPPPPNYPEIMVNFEACTPRNSGCFHSQWCATNIHCPERHLQNGMLSAICLFLLQKRVFPKSGIAVQCKFDPHRLLFVQQHMSSLNGYYYTDTFELWFESVMHDRVLLFARAWEDVEDVSSSPCHKHFYSCWLGSWPRLVATWGEYVDNWWDYYFEGLFGLKGGHGGRLETCWAVEVASLCLWLNGHLRMVNIWRSHVFISLEFRCWAFSAAGHSSDLFQDRGACWCCWPSCVLRRKVLCAPFRCVSSWTIYMMSN